MIQATSRPCLHLDGLTKRFGEAAVVDDVSLTVEQGEFVVLLGPSGCGKTTTLRMIAGFIAPSSGALLLDGHDLVNLPPYQRDMGVVFQSYALFPHMTIADNVAFGLQMRKMAKSAIAARVEKMLGMVKLSDFASRYPHQLSGGQQQRVALARALAIEPRLLLLDEPLSNLDAALRQTVAHDIRILQRETGITTIMVTHDQEEAMSVADRLVVMKDGRVQQIGRQEDLYERPCNPFVATFIGGSNLLHGHLRGSDLSASGATVRLAASYARAGNASLCLRPEAISLAPADSSDHQQAADRGHVAGEIELSTYLGHVVEHVVRIAPDVRIVIRESALTGTRKTYRPGDAVLASWTSHQERLFDESDAVLQAVAEPLTAKAAIADAV